MHQANSWEPGFNTAQPGQASLMEEVTWSRPQTSFIRPHAVRTGLGSLASRCSRAHLLTWGNGTHRIMKIIDSEKRKTLIGHPCGKDWCRESGTNTDGCARCRSFFFFFPPLLFLFRVKIHLRRGPLHTGSRALRQEKTCASDTVVLLIMLVSAANGTPWLGFPPRGTAK